MGNVPETFGNLAMFASHREPAWHVLGTVFNETVTSHTTMLDKAHLSGWNLRTESVPFPPSVTGEVSNVPNAMLRDNPLTGKVDWIGNVGDRYEIVSNEEAFEATQAIMDGASWETAGSMNNGGTVFGSLVLDRTSAVDGDKIKNYILVSTSHDGSGSLTFATTPVRVVCQNTLSLALGQAKQVYKVRHTKSAQDRMKQARVALGVASEYLDAWDLAMQALVSEKVTKGKFFEIVDGLFPEPEKDVKGSKAKWERKREGIATLWNAGTNDLADTAYKGLMVLTEDQQWNRRVRAGNVENAAAAGAGFDAATNVERNRLARPFLALAGVK